MILCAPPLSAQDAMAAPRRPSSQGQTLKTEPLPSGESIMDKFVEATGGLKAHKAMKSMVIKGKFDMPAQGMSADLTIYKAAPNLSKTEIDMPMGLGKMLDGCDGKTAWSSSAMTGPMVKTGRAAEEALEGAKFDEHNWRDRYTAATTLGVEKACGEDCYKVELSRKAGGPHVQYFSKASGLALKMEAETETEMGAIQATVEFQDYRKVGGVTMPFKHVTSAGGQTMLMTYSDVQVNVDIPKSTFELPAVVRALLEKDAKRIAGKE
jgi:outer membrane lipoprotein-sorting protein